MSFADLVHPFDTSLIPQCDEILSRQFYRMANREPLEDVHSTLDAEYLCDLMASAPSGVNVHVDLFCSNPERFIFNITVPLTLHRTVEKSGGVVFVEDDHTTLSIYSQVQQRENADCGHAIVIPRHTGISSAHIRRLTKGLLNHSTVMRSEPFFWLAPIMVVLNRVMSANGNKSIEDLLGLTHETVIRAEDTLSFVLPMA